MEFLASTHGTQGIAQTVRWPWKPMLIGVFEGPTEVQLKVGERLVATDQSQFDNEG